MKIMKIKKENRYGKVHPLRKAVEEEAEGTERAEERHMGQPEPGDKTSRKPEGIQQSKIQA